MLLFINLNSDIMAINIILNTENMIPYGNN
jgi:hypothetical protein